MRISRYIVAGTHRCIAPDPIVCTCHLPAAEGVDPKGRNDSARTEAYLILLLLAASRGSIVKQHFDWLARSEDDGGI